MHKEIEKRYLFQKKPEGKSAVDRGENTGGISAGYHNIQDMFRAINGDLYTEVARQYGQRCGHIPLDEQDAPSVLIGEHSPVITEQFQYLSGVFGREIQPRTTEELNSQAQKTGVTPLVVPYINLPETRRRLASKGLVSELWGLPPGIVDRLKNKADFHLAIAKNGIEGLNLPDFRIMFTQDFEAQSRQFLGYIDGLYKQHDMHKYKRGILVRPAESDGSYGAAIVREENGHKLFLPAGDKKNAEPFATWEDALRACGKYVRRTNKADIENRLVVSRLIDIKESPGMSLVILDGQVLSLGWNGQLQEAGTTACVGTHTYHPDAESAHFREQSEKKTTDGFLKLIKFLAEEERIDFRKINGIANIDIMIPGQMEFELQRRRGEKERLYVAESNPRFTNFTDAVLTGVAARRLPQTVASMRQVIEDGIVNIDKFGLPENIDPRDVRDKLAQNDARFKEKGVQVIARMTVNPMGLILLGDSGRAQREVITIVEDLSSKTSV